MEKGNSTSAPDSVMEPLPSLKLEGLEGTRKIFHGRDPSKKVYYMRAVDKTNGLYGAKGKRLKHQKRTHFIHISV